ncbi:hypothetical protein ACQJBY_027870 [Aegilops geniculata]
MRRDAAVAPAAVVTSPQIASGGAETGNAGAVVIDVDSAPAPAPASAAIDIDLEAGGASHGVACRICHLSPEGGDGPAAAPGSEVIRLGCCCKEELGHAHRQCAEAWFRIKGDRLSSELQLGSVRGPYSLLWTRGSLWLLGATNWRWWLGLYSTGSDGVRITG